MSELPPGTFVARSGDLATVIDESGLPCLIRLDALPEMQRDIALSIGSAESRTTPGDSLSLREAASVLGLPPDEAGDLLAAESVPRVAGWDRRRVEELARGRGRGR